MSSSISFILDNCLTTINFEQDDRFSPTTTLLNYLRSRPDHKGTKEGCAEGDCGACTVVLAEPDRKGGLSYKSVDSCLVFLPMIDGKQVITVENLRAADGELHPVQKAIVNTHGSQCGFCTPGIALSLFALYKNNDQPQKSDIEEYLAGNLCRCTGYQPIIEAAYQFSNSKGHDHFEQKAAKILPVLSGIKKTSFFFEKNRSFYARPASLQEALRLKQTYPSAIMINGATDIALRATKKHEFLPQILDLSAIETLNKIKQSGPFTIIGAGVSLQDIKTYAGQRFPALFTMLSAFGSMQIRNLATLGGNLGSASPIGDSAPLLIAYDARVALQSTRGVRKIDLNQFISGYHQTTALPDEIITAVEIPHPDKRAQVRFYKFSKRKDLDISTVSAGFRLITNHSGNTEEIRLVYGGLAEKTKRAVKTEQAIIGKKWTRMTVENSLPLIDQDFQPISDARASAEGRSLAARNLLLKFWSDTTAGIEN